MNRQLQRISTISEFHQLKGLPKPQHPLISVVDYSAMKPSAENNNTNWVLDFYYISIGSTQGVKIKYGQQDCDFDEGVMFFMAPGQVFNVSVDAGATPYPSGWMLFIHPDFLWSTSLAKSIKQYEYFDYSVNESLFLSEKEEEIINGIVLNIQQEYRTNIDKFTQGIIISQIETLLNYAERFYERQFITRKANHHKTLEALESILNEYFSSDNIATKGLPTVQYVAERLNVSPNYLSGVLKVLTGQSTQQHIHDKLIETAKEKLSTTDLSVSEIAYDLGFEHPQSFSKLFKTKTNLSPLEFRRSFN